MDIQNRFKSNHKLLLACLVSMFFYPFNLYGVAKKVSERYKLVGSIGGESTSAPEEGVAVIFDSVSNKTKTIRVGGKISKDVWLKAIVNRQVYLTDGSEDFKIEQKQPSLDEEIDLADSSQIDDSSDDAVVTVIDAWGRQTEVSLEEYLQVEEDLNSDFESQMEEDKPKIPRLLGGSSIQRNSAKSLIVPGGAGYPKLSYGIGKSALGTSILNSDSKVDPESQLEFEYGLQDLEIE